MTITLTKAKLAIAVLAVVMLVPATAWAKDNDITTGSPAGSKTFKPDDNVTRGESVTFLKRYDDNIVQPALDATASVIVRTNETEIVVNSSGFAAAACEPGEVAIGGGARWELFDDDNMWINDSFFESDESVTENGDVPDGFGVEAFNGSALDDTLVVQVVCAPGPAGALTASSSAGTTEDSPRGR